MKYNTLVILYDDRLKEEQALKLVMKLPTYVENDYNAVPIEHGYRVSKRFNVRPIREVE